MWGLIAGLVSYPAFAWAGHRLLQHFDWKPGLLRVLIVFLMATLLSSALGSGVSWVVTPPGQQSTQTVLERRLKNLLADELACFSHPEGAACQSFLHQRDALEHALLGRASGSGTHA
jgi:hypothetical protein